MTNKTNCGNIFVVKNCHSFLLQSAIVVLIVILQSGSGCYSQGLIFLKIWPLVFVCDKCSCYEVLRLFYFIVLVENVEEGISGAS